MSEMFDCKVEDLKFTRSVFFFCACSPLMLVNVIWPKFPSRSELTDQSNSV